MLVSAGGVTLGALLVPLALFLCQWWPEHFFPEQAPPCPSARANPADAVKSAARAITVNFFIGFSFSGGAAPVLFAANFRRSPGPKSVEAAKGINPLVLSRENFGVARRELI